MDIDALIRDLIEEEKFKATYTNRQRSIFCKNMHEKISSFMEPHKQELKKTQDILHKTRKDYRAMYKETTIYIWMTLFYSIGCFLLFCYLYYVYIICPYFKNK